jgi:hypothetical protein
VGFPDSVIGGRRNHGYRPDLIRLGRRSTVQNVYPFCRCVATSMRNGCERSMTYCGLTWIFFLRFFAPRAVFGLPFLEVTKEILS